MEREEGEERRGGDERRKEVGRRKEIKEDIIGEETREQNRNLYKKIRQRCEIT